MSHRSIRFGVIDEESNDKGPYKLARVKADGKKMDIELIDTTGVEGSPLKGSRVLILTPDGDDGKAVGIVYGPPVSQRTDKQKPGEVTYKNHATGTAVTFKANGDMVVDCVNDQVVTIKGKCTVTAGDRLTLKAPLVVVDGPARFKDDVIMEKNLDVSKDIANGGNMTTIGEHRDANGKHKP
jgi:phage gp45-like